jgi:hypothetical protein
VAAVACTAPALGLADSSSILGDVAGFWGHSRAQKAIKEVTINLVNTIIDQLHYAVQCAPAALTAGATWCSCQLCLNPAGGKRTSNVSSQVKMSVGCTLAGQAAAGCQQLNSCCPWSSPASRALCGACCFLLLQRCKVMSTPCILEPAVSSLPSPRISLFQKSSGPVAAICDVAFASLHEPKQTAYQSDLSPLGMCMHRTVPGRARAA